MPSSEFKKQREPRDSSTRHSGHSGKSQTSKRNKPNSGRAGTHVRHTSLATSSLSEKSKSSKRTVASRSLGRRATLNKNDLISDMRHFKDYRERMYREKLKARLKKAYDFKKKIIMQFDRAMNQCIYVRVEGIVLKGCGTNYRHGAVPKGEMFISDEFGKRAKTQRQNIEVPDIPRHLSGYYNQREDTRTRDYVNTLGKEDSEDECETVRSMEDTVYHSVLDLQDETESSLQHPNSAESRTSAHVQRIYSQAQIGRKRSSLDAFQSLDSFKSIFCSEDYFVEREDEIAPARLGQRRLSKSKSGRLRSDKPINDQSSDDNSDTDEDLSLWHSPDKNWNANNCASSYSLNDNQSNIGVVYEPPRGRMFIEDQLLLLDMESEGEVDQSQLRLLHAQLKVTRARQLVAQLRRRNSFLKKKNLIIPEKQAVEEDIPPGVCRTYTRPSAIHLLLSVMFGILMGKCLL